MRGTQRSAPLGVVLGTAMAAIVLLPAGLLLAQAPGAPVGNPTAPSEASAAGSAAETTAAPAGLPAEGVTVHGQWTIEVFEPDGTPVSRHEFENALTSDGAASLSKFLVRTASTGSWLVELGSSSASSLPCDSGAGTPVSCFVAESGISGGNNYFKNLTVSEGTGGDAGKVVLAGQATAQRDGAITGGTTHVGQCPATTAPATPCSGSLYRFTSTTITDIPVTPGQQIQVTVKLGFS